MNSGSDDVLLLEESVESTQRHSSKLQHRMVTMDSTSNPSEIFLHSEEKDSSVVATENSQKKKRHGARNQHKMKYFVQWIHETFLNDTNSSTTTPPTTTQAQPSVVSSSTLLEKPQHYILDVAGGKGELAARLVMCCKNIHVTMVDPRPADVAMVYHNWIVPKLPKKWQERYFMKLNENKDFIHEILTERYVQFQMYFTPEGVNGTDDTLRTAIEKCTLMIGMHADSATECIVDMALLYQKPFVVVPCCVFPNLFQQRFLTVISDEKTTTTTTTKTFDDIEQDTTKTSTAFKVPVRTYEQFCDYLHQKDARFQRTVLPFDGRNVAIWWDGK
jgi:hypothetical protein